MSFLTTIMLAGLAAVAVPIIIHLLNRRKFKTVTWAAMKFVKLSVDQNQRRMRIEDLILLLSRCALVALLALALARGSPMPTIVTGRLNGRPCCSMRQFVLNVIAVSPFLQSGE